MGHEGDGGSKPDKGKGAAERASRGESWAPMAEKD